MATCNGNLPARIRIIDVRKSRQIASFEAHGGAVNDLRFSPDGKLLASASDDKVAKVWDAATGSPVATLPHEAWVHALAFAPDGRSLATMENDFLYPTQETRLKGKLRLWDCQTWALISSRNDCCGAVAFAPDGGSVAAGGGGPTVFILRTPTLEPRLTVKTSVPPLALAYSFDGALLASMGRYAKEPGRVEVWDAAKGTLASEFVKKDHYWTEPLVFTPDGRHLLFSVKDDVIASWSVSTSSLEALPFRGPYPSLSSDGKMLATYVEGGVQTWSFESRQKADFFPSFEESDHQ